MTLRNLVAGMPWRVALMVSAFAFAYPTHEHPAYWLPWVLAPLIGGWAYLRTHNIWLAVAVAFPQHGVAWFEFLGIAPNIAGFDTPVGEVAVFQPLWFDALGLVLLMVGVGLLIRGFEVAGAAVPLPKPPRPSTGAEPPDAEDGED